MKVLFAPDVNQVAPVQGATRLKHSGMLMSICFGCRARVGYDCPKTDCWYSRAMFQSTYPYRVRHPLHLAHILRQIVSIHVPV